MCFASFGLVYSLGNYVILMLCFQSPDASCYCRVLSPFLSYFFWSCLCVSSLCLVSISLSLSLCPSLSVFSLTEYFAVSSFNVIFSCPLWIMFTSTSPVLSVRLQPCSPGVSSLPRFPFCVNIVCVSSCLLSIAIILPAVCSISLVFPSLISLCLHCFVICYLLAFMTVSCVWTFMKSWEKPNIWTIQGVQNY